MGILFFDSDERVCEDGLTLDYFCHVYVMVSNTVETTVACTFSVCLPTRK